MSGGESVNSHGTSSANATFNNAALGNIEAGLDDGERSYSGLIVEQISPRSSFSDLNPLIGDQASEPSDSGLVLVADLEGGGLDPIPHRKLVAHLESVVIDQGMLTKKVKELERLEEVFNAIKTELSNLKKLSKLHNRTEPSQEVQNPAKRYHNG